MRKSAGILAYRSVGKDLEFFLVHPGGPFWKGKETGAWSIPKGEFTDAEEPLVAAKREFLEETGQPAEGVFLQLEPVKQKAGKMIYAWAVECNVDAGNIVSNSFRMEYPYKSGKWITVPEVDKAAWLSESDARVLINPAQAALIDDLLKKLER